MHLINTTNKGLKLHSHEFYKIILNLNIIVKVKWLFIILFTIPSENLYFYHKYIINNNTNSRNVFILKIKKM